MAELEWSFKRGHDWCSSNSRARLDRLYRHRPMLPIQESIYTNGPQVSIMTYNLFSPSEEELYFIPNYTRERLLLREISRYNPDIVCLQEVTDHHRMVERFARRGYNMRVFTTNEYHSIAICYKWDLFQEFDHKKISFPRRGTTKSGDPRPSTHGALFLCLRFKPDLLDGHKAPSKDAIIVGTTHFPLKELMAADRAILAGDLLKDVASFAESIRKICNASFEFYTFIAGDLNSTVDDAAYISLVSKPVKYPRWAHDMLIRSINRNLESKVARIRAVRHVSKTPESLRRVARVEQFHNSIKQRAISLYSLGYSSVHEENSQPGCKEPWFSYCGKLSRDLLDYILVITDWDGESNTKVDSLTQFSEISGMRLLALLQMPTHEEMGPEDVCQPVVGVFPSDHMCMMADLELL